MNSNGLGLQSFENLSPTQQRIVDIEADFLSYEFEEETCALQKKIRKYKEQLKQFRQVIIEQNQEIQHLNMLHNDKQRQDALLLKPHDRLDRAMETNDDLTPALVHQLENEINELRRAHGITKSSSNLQLANNNDSSAMRNQELLNETEIDKIIDE